MKRLREEVLFSIGPNRVPTHDDLKQLKYREYLWGSTRFLSSRHSQFVPYWTRPYGYFHLYVKSL